MLLDYIHEILVNARVIRKLWMKRQRNDIALPRRHDKIVKPGKHFHSVTG